MKIMSIIGIVWFSISLMFITLFLMTDELDASAGWGVLGLLYALPFAIVSLVKSSKKRNITQELIDLRELKDKGILSEEEFQAKKNELLKM